VKSDKYVHMCFPFLTSHAVCVGLNHALMYMCIFSHILWSTHTCLCIDFPSLAHVPHSYWSRLVSN